MAVPQIFLFCFSSVFLCVFLNLWNSLYLIDFNCFICVENIFFHLSLTIISFLVSFLLHVSCSSFFFFSGKNLNFFFLARLRLYKTCIQAKR